jgi:hypothetical protein
MNITKEGEEMAKMPFRRRLRHQVVRTGCCGKKRKASQCVYKDTTGDHGTWFCKKGFGCKKTNYL